MKSIDELDTVDPQCKRCDGTGWVCASHRDKPWADGWRYPGDAGKAGCHCDAGAPCPDCNDLAHVSAPGTVDFIVLKRYSNQARRTRANDTSDQPLDCPFCGSTVEIAPLDDREPDLWGVSCRGCIAHIEEVGKAAAIAAWNRRPPLSGSGEEAVSVKVTNHDEAIRLVKNIKWESADKDNMEFTARVSCYQRDVIDEILRLAEATPSMSGDSRPETVSEHIARDMREGRFPRQSERQNRSGVTSGR